MVPNVNTDSQDGGGWLIVVAQLPTEQPAIRMRVLRTLESLGAAVMRDGAFVLPVSPLNGQALERLADYVNRNAGTAYVFHCGAGPAAQEQSLQRLFDRSTRYEELVKTVESLKVGFGVSDPGVLSRLLHKQRREFDAIAALDFFPSEARSRAQAALDDAERAVRNLVFPAKTQAPPAVGEMQGRVWATRRPLWADRLACAWLIHRFINPGAKVRWLEPNEPCPEDAVGFAFEGAHFSNSETRVTFEELVSRLGMAKDPALSKIGNIVHFLEVRDAPVPEAAGVQTLLQGAVRRSTNDDMLLVEAEKTFDLLYEAY